MCGLTGFYELKDQRNRSHLRAVCRSMTDTLQSRGPDQGDVWLDADLPLALGHRRLSILDLSDAGRQPMQSASGRYVIAFNGEIYNFLSLRADLEAKGTAFKGRSDTEVILAALDVWGLNMTLQKLNGMFAFALWDKQSRTLHFARDRMGKKPLYIGWAQGALVFGSELKALRAHPAFKASVDQDALAGYMRSAYVSAPRSIYNSVWQLMPGHRLSLVLADLAHGEDISARMEPFWQATQTVASARTAGFDGTEDDAINQFEALLMQSTRERMISDVPLGAFLSGGIDSSAVVAMMQAQSGAQVKTYSIGFTEAGFDEAVYAKRVAQHLGTDHHELYVSEADALAVIPDLPNMYDEPFADISAIPTALVSQFARRDVTVALSGDGGDEMLGGYNRHIDAPRLWGLCGWMPSAVRRRIGGGTQAISVEKWDALLRALKPQAGTAMHKLAGLLQQKDERAIYDYLCSQWQGQGTMPDLPAIDGLSFAERMMLWDSVSYLPHDILTKVDRASMAHSLEVRAPLLDTRLFDFAWRLPLKYKIRGGTGKWLLRQVLARHVPPAMFERPKQGFSMPVGAWLRGDLRDWAEDLLSEHALQEHGLLDAAQIRTVWDAHLSGLGDHATQLWTVLMFQAWHKKWMNHT